MFFRNLTFFRFPYAAAAEVNASGEMNLAGRMVTIEDDLAACTLRPVGPLELSSRGFVSPYGRDSDQLVHIDPATHTQWLTVGAEERVLPAAAVNEALAAKLAEIEKREGIRPGGRTRKRLKDELVTEMLPRAFVKAGRIDALIDYQHCIVAVDTSSRMAGEGVVSEIRRALGSFPALPLNAEVAPRSVLTGWVAGNEMPEGLVIGEECELRDPTDQGAVVKVQRMDLHSDEIGRHLESGKQVTRLALTFQDRASFVVGEDLVVRKFRLLEGAADDLEGTEAEDVRGELNARCALMAGELRAVFGVLEQAFRISDLED